MSGFGVTEGAVAQGKSKLQLDFWEKWSHVFEAIWVGVGVDKITMPDALGGSPLRLSVREENYYIPSGYLGTISMPQEQALEQADDDQLWFHNGVVQNTPSTLTNYTHDRTLVRYLNNSPYDIVAIGLLKYTTVLTPIWKDLLSKDFQLWVFQFGTWNDNGFIKDNRLF